MPCAVKHPASHTHGLQPDSFWPGSEISPVGLLKYGIIQGEIGHQPLQPCILLLKLLQPLGLINPHAAILLTPSTISLCRDAQLTADICRLGSLDLQHLSFAKHADDLLWCVAFPAHFLLLLSSKILTYHLDRY
ncbi:hypothetical protein ES702_06847 [subsurface metagenome]